MGGAEELIERARTGAPAGECAIAVEDGTLRLAVLLRPAVPMSHYMGILPVCALGALEGLRPLRGDLALAWPGNVVVRMPSARRSPCALMHGWQMSRLAAAPPGPWHRCSRTTSMPLRSWGARARSSIPTVALPRPERSRPWTSGAAPRCVWPMAVSSWSLPSRPACARGRGAAPLSCPAGARDAGLASVPARCARCRAA